MWLVPKPALPNHRRIAAGRGGGARTARVASSVADAILRHVTPLTKIGLQTLFAVSLYDITMIVANGRDSKNLSSS